MANLSWDFNPVLNPVLDSEGLCIWRGNWQVVWAVSLEGPSPPKLHPLLNPASPGHSHPHPVLHCRGAILRESFSESYSLTHCHLYAMYFSLRLTRQGLRVLEIINPHSLFMPEEISPRPESTLPSPPESQDRGIGPKSPSLFNSNCLYIAKDSRKCVVSLQSCYKESLTYGRYF